MVLNYETIFGEITLNWGNKYPRESTLLEVWRKDPDYLRWACNLQGGKAKNRFELPALQKNLVSIAHLMSIGEDSEAQRMFAAFEDWRRLSQEGVGLAELPRPSRAECVQAIKSANKVVGHFDLDGVFSLALLISEGALSDCDPKTRIDRIKLVQYGIPALEAYSNSIDLQADDNFVIVDFAAHPAAAVTFDHHSTSLSYWELGSPVPCGVFDTARPSCPGLIADYCGFKLSQEVIDGCDMIDGARYPNVEAAGDLSNPFTALNMALNLDVSDRFGREVVMLLAENGLRPEVVLRIPSWQTRVKLIEHQLAEQRAYWKKPEAIYVKHPLLAVADGRNAPNSTTRFRFLPFELPEIQARPYLITLRPGWRGGDSQFGISRNPFYDAAFFKAHPLDLGALCKKLGLSGGGRVEAAATSVPKAQISPTIKKFQLAMEESSK